MKDVKNAPQRRSLDWAKPFLLLISIISMFTRALAVAQGAVDDKGGFKPPFPKEG